MRHSKFAPLVVCLGLILTACAGPDEDPSLGSAESTLTDGERQSEEQNLMRELDETALPLSPGEYRWYPQISPSGPVVILVSIPDQLAKVYRNGIRIGISTVSTGKTGHETPTGVFHILEKDRTHVSNLFPGAAMPNMQRLTWTGIALHAGKLPGFPASHGCVRMPEPFSALLFEVTDDGGTVVIADEISAPTVIAHSGLVLPTATLQGLEQGESAGEREAEVVWNPEVAPEGPVGIVVSGADQRAHIYRGGVLIGQVPLQIEDPERPLPAGVSTVLAGTSDEPNPFAPDVPMPLWMAVALPTGATHESYHTEIVGRIRADPEIGNQLFSLLHPGASLVVTNLPLSAESTTDRDFVIATSDLPEAAEQSAQGAETSAD